MDHNHKGMRQFAVIVEGDVMEPKYLDGDQVVFSVDDAEREGIIEGRSYFLKLEDERQIFRRVFVDPDDGDTLVLKCWNEKYRPMLVARSNVRLLAKVMGVFRPVDY